MLYLLSKLIPVPMRSSYETTEANARLAGPRRERATWWQWRGHVYRHRVTRLA